MHEYALSGALSQIVKECLKLSPHPYIDGTAATCLKIFGTFYK